MLLSSDSMALVRLLCFSTSSQFSTQQLLSFSLTTPPSSLPKRRQLNNTLSRHLPSVSLSTSPSPSPSPSPLYLTLPIKTRKPSNPFIALSSSTQSQATIETPEFAESAQSQLAEEEDEQLVDEASQTRVLAQNVPWTSTIDDIRPLFEKYGTVVDIEFSMFNKTKNRNRGLAFVTMGSHEEALAAINNLESYEFEGRALRLTWAKPKKEKSSPVAQKPKPAPIHNLFVANLPFHARAKDLKEFFNSENGNAVSAEIIFHENPRSSAGYGFVSFNTKQEAEAALSAFEGKLFMGRSIRVARSRRFLRQGTKATILLESASAKVSPNTEQPEAADAA